MKPLLPIQFDHSDLDYQGNENGPHLWYTSSGDPLLLFHFPIPPDLPFDPAELTHARNFYRQGISAQGGAIVEVETFPIGHITGIKVIFKVPQEPTGMTYIGSITLPFEQFSYVIKMQCPEFGTTGMRDAIIFEKHLASGSVTIDAETDTIIGWAQDPYKPEFVSTLLKNLSDNKEYDDMFPEHPLSRLRKTIEPIISTLKLGKELHDIPAYKYM